MMPKIEAKFQRCNRNRGGK